MNHSVTEKDLNEWLCRPQWQIFASSADRDGVKRLEVDNDGSGPVFRVTVKGEVTFLGADKASALSAYNTAR